MSEYGPDDVGVDDWEDEGESLREVLVAIIPVLTFGLGVSSAVFGYGDLTAPIFVVGWFLLTPLVAILSDTRVVRRLFGDLPDDQSSVGDDEAALEQLKARYARGEIDEAEFERRTARLLENESIDDVRDRVDRTTPVDADRRAPRRDAGGDRADERRDRADRDDVHATDRDGDDERGDDGRRDRDLEREYET